MLRALISSTYWTVPERGRDVGQRGLLVAALALLVSTVPGGWGIAFDAMSEAYLAVAVFVAGTLVLVMAAERSMDADLGAWLHQNRRWQVPAATLLGAFPGCGGAIVAVTQYTRGYLSFGSVVATLTATMGDAMFLLLARDPGSAFLVLGVSMPVAVVTGYAIDAIHGADFLRPDAERRSVAAAHKRQGSLCGFHRYKDMVWLALMVPGLVVGVLAAFQVDVDAFVIESIGIALAHWLGVAGAALGLIMWIDGDRGQSGLVGDISCKTERPAPLLQSVADTTNFVMAWVIFAFVGFDVFIAVSGIDLAQLFSIWAPVVPAVAVLVGFIPGCGPQIMITTLYLAGTVPLSAQLGNAIANDGDALFPAIAVAPRTAIVATVYSAIPALIVAYGWYMLAA